MMREILIFKQIRRIKTENIFNAHICYRNKGTSYDHGLEIRDPWNVNIQADMVHHIQKGQKKFIITQRYFKVYI